MFLISSSGDSTEVKKKALPGVFSQQWTSCSLTGCVTVTDVTAVPSQTYFLIGFCVHCVKGIDVRISGSAVFSGLSAAAAALPG